MAPILYMIHASPPSRAVLMTAKGIGLRLNIKEVDFFNEEHLKPPFLQMNPQHTVPTLVDDDGFALWDSHAIMTYLVSKYAKNDALYPKDLKKRAIIDQRLHFESGVVFALLRRIARPIVLQGQTFIEQRDKDGVLESYDLLEAFLEGKLWAAGGSVTLADYSLISSISTLSRVVPVDPQKCPRLTDWIERCEGLPEYEVNKRGLAEMVDLLTKKTNN